MGATNTATTPTTTTSIPPHGSRNQIAPRLPDKCALGAPWDDYDDVDIEIGVDVAAADDYFLTISIFMLKRHL